MKKLFKRLGLTLCFLAIMTAVSFAVPPGFLVKSPEPTGQTAEVLSLDPDATAGECRMTFRLDGDILPITEPLESCAKYRVGDKVKV
jgi:hypothetical protein